MLDSFNVIMEFGDTFIRKDLLSLIHHLIHLLRYFYRLTEPHLLKTPITLQRSPIPHWVHVGTLVIATLQWLISNLESQAVYIPRL